jgi:hypothetical protein
VVSYAVALAVTVIVEVPVYLLLRRWAFAVVATPEGRADGNGPELGWYAGVNVVSHPVLWFVLVPAGVAVLGATAGILVAEGLVVAGEGAALSLVLRGRAPVLGVVAVAALANAASFSLGLVP